MADVIPETEVLAKAKRRNFSTEYKQRILAEVDACKEPGAIGAVLRREGLYSSHLTEWRAARKTGTLASPPKRGPKPQQPDPRDRRIAELERENRRLQARAEKAELLVDIQKKVASILGIELAKSDDGKR
jgi:transposase-like protein